MLIEIIFGVIALLYKFASTLIMLSCIGVLLAVAYYCYWIAFG